MIPRKEIMDKLHNAVDENGFHGGYPEGPEDDRLLNLNDKDLRLIVWAYGCELRRMKEVFADIQADMWHEALYDHEENIIHVEKFPGSNETIRCFAIKEETVSIIHSKLVLDGVGITKNAKKSVKKNGTLLKRDGYKLTKTILDMTRQELIEELIGSFEYDYLVENNFVEKMNV